MPYESDIVPIVSQILENKMANHEEISQLNTRIIIEAILSTQIDPNRPTWFSPDTKSALRDKAIFDAVTNETIRLLDGPATGEIMLLLMQACVQAALNVLDTC
jgi:hypothetical protein